MFFNHNVGNVVTATPRPCQSRAETTASVKMDGGAAAEVHLLEVNVDLFGPFRKGNDGVDNIVELVGVGVFLPAAATARYRLVARTAVVVDGVQAIIQSLPGHGLELLSICRKQRRLSERPGDKAGSRRLAGRRPHRQAAQHPRCDERLSRMGQMNHGLTSNTLWNNFSRSNVFRLVARFGIIIRCAKFKI